MIALILAAGYGTRLYPLTTHLPKALLPIQGKAILNYIVEKLTVPSVGAREIVLVSNHRYAEQFQSWFEKESISGPWTVLDDGSTSEEDRLGSIGDLTFAIQKHKIHEDLLVVGSDNLFQDGLEGFCDFARRTSPGLTLGTYKLAATAEASRFGVLTVDSSDRITRFEEKPQNPESTLISTAIYFFPAQKLSWVLKYPGLQDTLGSFIHWLVPQETVCAYRFSGPWFDIGDVVSYKHAQETFSK